MTMSGRKLLLDMDGATATATMFEEYAPKTCEAVWNILPVTGRSIHANWSGREMMLHLEGDKILRLPQEVPVHSNYIYEGDIHYFYRASSLSRGSSSHTAPSSRGSSPSSPSSTENPPARGFLPTTRPAPHTPTASTWCASSRRWTGLSSEAFKMKCESRAPTRV